MGTQKLFVSYSHKDRHLLEILKTHIKPLERRGIISPWFDGHIIPGDDIDKEIGKALRESDIIVLLVSPDFLASDYCYHTEMTEALRRHEEGSARVVPVILRKCEWEEEKFGKLLGLPTDGKAIMSLHWPDKDEAWNIVTKGIKAAAQAEGPQSNPTRHFTNPEPSSSDSASQRPLQSSPMGLPHKRTLTDEERDDFKHQAFEEIAQRFEASVKALDGHTTGRIRRLDANRFVATLYQSGTKKSGITVYVGGEHHFGNGIKYHLSDDGRTDTLNDSLEIALRDGVLCLKSTMGSWMSSSAQEQYLNNQQAAERIWDAFVSRMG